MEKTTEAIRVFAEKVTRVVVNLFGAVSLRAMLETQFPGRELILDDAGSLIIRGDDIHAPLKQWIAFLAQYLNQNFGHDATENIFRVASRNLPIPIFADSETAEEFLQYIPEGFFDQERVAHLSHEELKQRVLERTRELQNLNAQLEERVAQRTKELVATNTSLRELLQDLDNAGKMLVRRDLELTRANARLEELDAIKTEFVSIAAHQLRTPLTGIRWSYQALLDGESGVISREQRHLLESGLGATLRMVDLVNDLLSVARIEEGKFGMRLRTQSLVPLLARLIERYTALAEQKGIRFSSTLPATLPNVAFDEEKMEIVCDNLLDNSLKYTEPGGTIGLKVSYEKGSVCIEVSDTGVGISQDQIHRVFTKFFRADNALRLHTSGTGLGLYVVKNIIEKHGGSVDVKSREGKGSIFLVTLPVV